MIRVSYAMTNYLHHRITPHFPVMLDEVIKICSPDRGGTFIDCTFGGGGYSKEILNFSKTKVIALDRDNFIQNLTKS